MEDLSGCAIPDRHGVVPAGRGEAPAIRAEGHALDMAVVAAQRVHRLARAGIPDSYGPVRAGRGHALALGVKGHADDFAGMALESGKPALAQPLEVTPFPLAQLRRAGFE